MKGGLEYSFTDKKESQYPETIVLANESKQEERKKNMKSWKKIAAVAMTAAMLATVPAVSVFAAGYTVTITQNPQDKGTHTYGAYQIFKGDLAEDGTLSNIQWGSGISDEGKTALGDAEAYAKTITSDNAAAKADELAQYLAAAEKTGSTSITDLEGGYYLIQDDTDPEGTPASKTKYILRVVRNVDVAVKSSVPSVEKKVQDINDSDETPTLTNLQDSADYDIGDTVPYTITATIGSGISNYSAYSFNFVDDISSGLTLVEDSWDIKVGTKSIKDSFTLSNDGTVWTWAATNIKGEISDGSQVVLTYNCILNQNAVVGATGNPNEVKLQFDNNPNSCGEGKPEGETPWDKNIVFTYKTVFNKVDNNKQPVTGADFKLEKKVNGAWVDVTGLNTGDGAANPTKTVTGNKFEFTGLDDGDYKLTETATPPSYNSIDPIEFTITADHDITSEDPRLTSLTGTDGKEFTMTPSETDGTLTADIINEKGSTLPETGGMGTTIFYIVGTVLVIGAGVLLVTRRRMSAQ